MRKSQLLLTLLLIIAVTLVACGGDSDDSTDSDKNTDTNAQTTDNDTEEPNDDTTENAEDSTEETSETPSTFTLIDAPEVVTLGRGNVNAIALSPDDSVLAIGTATGMLYVYDTADLSAEPTLIEIGNEQINDVAFHPEGAQVAVAHRSGAVHVVDVTTGDTLWAGFTQRGGDIGVAVVNTLTGSSATIPSVVAFSPDGSLLAVVFENWGSTALFDASTGENPRVLGGRTPITPGDDVHFSPDGTQVISTYQNDDIDVYDVASGELVIRREDQLGVKAFSLNEDGSLIATTNIQSGPKFVTLVNTADLTTTVEVEVNGLGESILLTPDGEHVIVSRQSNVFFGVRVLDVETLTPTAQFRTLDVVTDIAITNDGATLYIASFDGVRVVDATALIDGAEDLVLEEATDFIQFNSAINDADLTDDLSTAVACERNGTASFYDVATGERTSTIRLPEDQSCIVRYTADESAIVTKVNLEFYGVPVEGGDPLFDVRISNNRAVTTDGTVIVSAQGRATDPVRVYDLTDVIAGNAEPEVTFEFTLEETGIERITGGDTMSISTDGSRLAISTRAAGDEGSVFPVFIVEPLTGEMLTQTEPWTEIIRDMSLSGDGSTLALVGYEDMAFDGDRIIMQIIDVSGELPVVISEPEISDPENKDLRITSIAVNETGSLVAMQADDGIMHLFDVEAGNIVASFETAFIFHTLRFMPDNGMLIGTQSPGLNNPLLVNGIARIWDVSDYITDMPAMDSGSSSEGDAEATAEATEDSE